MGVEMTNEEREAAQRIIDTPDISFDGVTWQCVESADAKLVAAALLREHPADDDEAVAEFETFPLSMHRRLEIGIAGVGRIGAFYTDIGSSSCGEIVEDVYLCDVVTRGDVRRLCTALGIETKAMVTA